MFNFKKEQKTFKIGNIEIGGKPGELPTVLIGTIFYEGHSIVSNAEEGIFDKAKAEELINKQEEFSEKTGCPSMIDIVGLTTNAMIKYIDFVSEKTDSPILIDSSFPEIKIAGVKHCAEIGLLDRIVYNSISHNVKNEELNALKELGVKSAIILAFNPRDVRASGKLSLLIGEKGNGLLKKVEENGIEKPLIDVAILDVPSIGISLDAINLIKSETGLPCGGAPLNAVLEWKKVVELGDLAKNLCSGGSLIALKCAGADFILYGPIEKSKIVFPVAAMIDAIIAYRNRWYGIKPKTKNHPLYKIF
jgi:tetrahydromethanopterin S-methyltransferase subunit H